MDKQHLLSQRKTIEGLRYFLLLVTRRTAIFSWVDLKRAEITSNKAIRDNVCLCPLIWISAMNQRNACQQKTIKFGIYAQTTLRTYCVCF